MQAGDVDRDVTKNLDLVPEHLRELSTRAESMKLRLNQLKDHISSKLEYSSSDSSQQRVEGIRNDLRKARDTLMLFKSMILNGAVAESQAHELHISDPTVARPNISEDDPSRPLIDRIGGEIVLETLIHSVYDRFLEDVRLRAFFEKSARKMDSIKRRFYQFLLGYIGGKVTYDESNLKPSHYHLNITNYHFDAAIENFEYVMLTQLKVHPNAVREFLSTISRVRTDVTTGYTIRSEVARINTTNTEQLLHRVGDLDGIIRFIDKLYDLIAKDSRIRNFFVGANFEKIKHGQRMYITELLGGPNVYKGGRLLEEIHSGLGVNDYHFDCWMQDVERALSQLNIDDAIIDQVIVQLETVRNLVVVGSRHGEAAGPSSRVRVGLDNFNSIISTGTVSSQSSRIVTKPATPVDMGGEEEEPTVSLLAQLGGSQNVESLVEIVYNTCFNDPRLRFFFPSSKARAEVFKRGLTNACVTVSGGPVLYDLTNLRNVHQKMNISDFHFDTFISIIESCACSVKGLEESVVKELVTRLAMLRTEITAGCTVRFELAKQRSEDAGGVVALTKSLDPIGDDTNLTKVIDQLYKFVKTDPRINSFFQGATIDLIIQSQKKFLIQLFGGHGLYTGPEIRRVHARLNVSDYHFEAFVDNLAKAVILCGFSQDTVDECIVALEQCRLDVVNPTTRIQAAMNSAPCNRSRLYELLGGEAGLAELASEMIEAAKQDDRMKKFYEINLVKIESKKKNLAKFYQVILSNNMTRAVREQWESRLRTAHSLLNIPDGLVDLELELLSKYTGKKFPNISSNLIDEFVSSVAQFRGCVTHGYRVRKEFAVARIQEGESHRLFGLLGGDVGIEKIVNRWTRLIRNDARVWSRYGKDIEAFQSIHKRAVSYLVQHNGRDLYSDMDSLVELKDLHAKMGTSDYTFDVLVGDLEKAMVDLAYNQDVVNEVVVIIIESIRDLVVFGGGSFETRRVKNAIFRDGSSLYDRIGESEMEQWIDCAMERVESNTRICSFFDIPKSRMRAFKRRLVRFLSNKFGQPNVVGPPRLCDPQKFSSNMSNGTESYGGFVSVDASDTDYLRKVHGKFNISDQVFDEFIGCLLVGASDCGIEGCVVEDLEVVLKSMRKDVVVGWTMRSYKAHESLLAEPVTVYERLGGTSTDPGLDRFIGRLFELAERDKRISEFFVGSRSIPIRKAQGDFIVGLVGGPVSRSRPLDEVHRIYCISSHHFDCFLRCVMNAARDCGADPELIDEVIVILEPFRDVITTGTSPDNFLHLVNPADLQAI